MEKKISVLINNDKIRKFNKIISVESDKSISHRSLLIASQCIGPSNINNILESEDVKNTIICLQKLGVKILKKNKKYIVYGNGLGSFKKPKNNFLYTGNSGTLTRLIFSLIGTHLEDELVDNLNKNNFLHPALNTHLPKKIKISKFERFDEELKSNPDIVALAISSKGIDWACEQLIKNYSKDHRFVLLTKGLTLMDNKISTISSKINSIFKKKDLPILLPDDVDLDVTGNPLEKHPNWKYTKLSFRVFNWKTKYF